MGRQSRRAVACVLAGTVVAAVVGPALANERRRVEVRAVEPTPIPGGGIRLAIRLSGPAEFRWQRLREPERVFVDIEGARLLGMPYELRVGWGGVERLWARQNAPNVVRVVAGLAAPMEVAVETAEDGSLIALDLRPRGEGEGPTGRGGERARGREGEGATARGGGSRPRGEERRAASRAPEAAKEEPPPLAITDARFLSPVVGDPETITGITARNLSADRAEVRVQGGRRLTYKTLRLEQPARFVVDMLGGRDGVRASPIVMEEGLLGSRAVRIGQFTESPPVFRLVVELPEGAWGEVQQEDSGELVVEVIRRPAPSLARGGASRAPARGKSPWSGALVGIDPGHGGSDPGAISMVGISEKEITLDIALRVRELLTAMGVNTALTRRDDRRLPKEERIRFVQRKDLDLFLSIHCDAAENPNATGVTTYVHGWNQPSRTLAACIQGELVKAMGLPDRGVCPDTKIHRTGFYVLRNAACPAVLIEAGFVSHAPTALQLSRPEYRQRVAQGIVAGLRKYWSRTHGDNVTRR